VFIFCFACHNRVTGIILSTILLSTLLNFALVGLQAEKSTPSLTVALG
jgi:hypothetical protein